MAEDLSFINDRLSLPAVPRIMLYTGSSSVVTFFIGAIAGGKKTGYQYLAENAHRLPTTQEGWYFYHKTKNYRVMYGGIKSGIRYARRTAIWTLLYAGTEASLDTVRGTIDALNTTCAAVSTAAMFSWRNNFSRHLTRRTMKMSFFVGAGVGVLQDALIWSRGGRMWYLDAMFSSKQAKDERAR